MQLQQTYDCFIKELKNRECATYFPEYFLEDRPLNWLQTLVTCVYFLHIYLDRMIAQTVGLHLTLWLHSHYKCICAIWQHVNCKTCHY